MKNIKLFFLGLLFFGSISFLEPAFADVRVETKNGNIYTGKIIHSEKGKSIELRLRDGSLRTLPWSEVVSKEEVESLPESNETEAASESSEQKINEKAVEKLSRAFIGAGLGGLLPVVNAGSGNTVGVNLGGSVGFFLSQRPGPRWSLGASLTSAMYSGLSTDPTIKASATLSYLSAQALYHVGGFYIGPQIGLSLVTATITVGSIAVSVSGTGVSGGALIGYEIPIFSKFTLAPEFTYAHSSQMTNSTGAVLTSSFGAAIGMLVGRIYF